jgi:2'-5' RNA ligase
MPRDSLDLVPDERGVRAVQALWERLRDAGLPSQGGHRGRSNKVHLTLAESPSIPDPGRAAGVVAAMLPLTLPVTGLVVLGSGRSAVALLVSVPSDLAAAVARLRAEVGQAEPPWVAHVTLARQVPRAQVGRVVEAVAPHGLTALRFVQLRHWQPQTRDLTVLR